MIKVKVKGLDKLRKNLRAFEKRFAKEVALPALEKGGDVLVQEARDRVPVHSGDLSEAIGLEVGTDGFRAWFSVGVSNEELRGKRPADYAERIEFGHVHSRGGITEAQPFMRPALDENKAKIQKVIVDEAGRRLEKL